MSDEVVGDEEEDGLVVLKVLDKRSSVWVWSY